MALLIGTDEAGYGPNLGPLVISATVWECNGDWQSLDLEHALQKLTGDGDPRYRLAIADSKQVFSPAGGFRQLERTLFTFLALQRAQPTNWQGIWSHLASSSVEQFTQLPWYNGFDVRVPVDLELTELHSLVKNAGLFFADAPVRFCKAASRSVEPPLFNELSDQLGNKASLLTDVTLKLVEQVLGQYPPQPALVLCDKHGGRNRYLAALQTVFPEHLIRVISESGPISVYRSGTQEAPIEFRFVAKGERLFPVALASMFSKYLRELGMLAFNEFWARHEPGLKPTAGYPLDAKRFRIDISPAAKRLAIGAEVFWRTR